MKRKFVWLGAGVFFVIAVGSGFIPDLRLGSEIRKARESGLMLLDRPEVQPKAEDNASPVYRGVITKFGSLPRFLISDFAGQVKANTPQMGRYLQAMSDASKCPAYSPVENGAAENTPDQPVDVYLFATARAATELATGADQLEGPARMAKHLGDRGTALKVGQWAFMVNAVLDRAKALHLSPAQSFRIASLLGPPLSARQALHDHVARTIRKMEDTAKMDGRGASRVRDEVAYLQFWREFFAENPPNRPIKEVVRAKESLVEEAEARNGDYMDFEGLFGPSASPWTDWAKLVDEASQRLASAH